MPSVCPTLEKANEARRRAWNELQGIRKLLVGGSPKTPATAVPRSAASVLDDLPPPPKPRSFETEGAILRAALERALREPRERIAALEKAVEGIKPYLSNRLNDGKYPLRVLDLNRAMVPPAAK